MRTAMQVVKENIDNPDFSVEALASAMNMSRSNLHLRVKALFGVSSLEFIKTVRLNEACRLLLERMHSISEIAYAMPRHRVVPYPNVSRKNYPYNERL